MNMKIENLKKANELDALYYHWKERLQVLQSLIEHEEDEAIDIHIFGVIIKSSNEQFRTMISIEIENAKARIFELERDIEEL